MVATHGTWHVRVATCLCLTPRPGCILARGAPGMHERPLESQQKAPKTPSKYKGDKTHTLQQLDLLRRLGGIELSKQKPSKTHLAHKPLAPEEPNKDNPSSTKPLESVPSLVPDEAKCHQHHGAHGVVASRPLRMRKALGSNPSVSIFVAASASHHFVLPRSSASNAFLYTPRQP